MALLAPRTRRKLSALSRARHLTNSCFASLSALSFATTGSSLKDMEPLYKSQVPVHVVDHFYDIPITIAAIVDRVNGGPSRLPNPDEVHLLFSAHGLPMALVEKGDRIRNRFRRRCSLCASLAPGRNPHAYVFKAG